MTRRRTYFSRLFLFFVFVTVLLAWSRCADTSAPFSEDEDGFAATAPPKKALPNPSTQQTPNPNQSEGVSWRDKLAALSRSLRAKEKTEPETTIPGGVILFRTVEEIEAYEEVFAAAAPAYEKSQAAEAIAVCLLSFAERSGIDPLLDKLEQHKWYVVLSVVVREKDSYIAEARIDRGSSLPAVYDEEMKRCYLDSFVGITFESDETESYQIRFFDRLVPERPKLPPGLFASPSSAPLRTSLSQP
jgi:hypothetical protein